MTDGALDAIEVIALAERTTPKKPVYNLENEDEFWFLHKAGNIDLLGDVEQK